jgi:hypothetical protein
MKASGLMAKKSEAEIDEALANAEIDPSTIEKRIKGFLYGELGTWKTSTAGLMVKEKGLIIAADNGFLALENLPGLDGKKSLLDSFSIQRYSGLSQLRYIAERVENGKYKDYDVIMIDTISQIQEEYLDFILEHVNYGGKFREKVNIDKEGKEEMGVDSIEAPVPVDYHILRNQFRPVIKSLIKADIDIWFLAHVKEPGPMDKVMYRRPSLTDGVYKVISRECNIMGFCTKVKKNTEATISFEQTPLQVAKSQIGVLRDKTVTQSELVKIVKDWKTS